jgi:4-carboxymuconolactone decarboxylase
VTEAEGQVSAAAGATPELDELAAMMTHYPKLWAEGGHLFTETLYESVPLDDRTIQLVLCSLLAAHGWRTGLRVHAAKALEVGATADEVRGAVVLTWAVQGLKAAVSGLDQIEDILAGSVGGG